MKYIVKNQVIMDPVPEQELPAMVDYTPEVFIAYPSPWTSFVWFFWLMPKSHVTKS